MNIYDLISRAQKLRKETQLDSVSPDRVGGLHEDTLKYINEFQLLASSPSLHKIYASVSAMQSDGAPKSDLTGKPLKPGQLVVIVPASQSDATAGDVYRYDGPSGNTSAWTFVAKIGAVPADAELSATSINPPQNKVVTEKLTELESKIDGEDSTQTLYATCNAANNQKNYTKILSNVTSIGACKMVTAGDVVYTGKGNNTCFGIFAISAGATDLSSIANISDLINGGATGQIYPSGTEVLSYAGNGNLGEAKDIYVGSRFSGTVGVIFAGERIEGLTDKVNAHTEQIKKNTADIVSNSSRISALENGAISSIIDLYKQQIQQARQLGYRSTKSESLYPIKPLAFMHISDTHTSKPNTRAIQILNYLGANGFVKFLMHTGDILEDPKSNPPAWSNIVAAAQYPVLLTSGNHDVGNWATSPSQYKTDAQFYNAFVAPQINAWGLKSDGGGTPHPSGKNYYFTDFTDEKIRLIVAYEYEIPSVSTQTDAGRGARWISQEQTNWFINSLLTTPAGYGVIVAKHAPEGLIGNDRNPFNSPFKDGENTQQTFQYRDGVAYTAFFADIVQAFIDRTSINYVVSQSAASYQGTINVIADFRSMLSDVEFICYVSGHVHADNITHLATHPKQLELNINCDNTIANNQRSETLLIEGTTFEDAINVYGIDRNQGVIHVLRIGANYSSNGDNKDMLTIAYR